MRERGVEDDTPFLAWATEWVLIPFTEKNGVQKEEEMGEGGNNMNLICPWPIGHRSS